MKPQAREHIVSAGVFFNISKIHTIPSISKNYTAHPHYMVHIPGKYSNASPSYSAKTKRDVHTERHTDRQIDGGGGGAFQYIAAGDKTIKIK